MKIKDKMSQKLIQYKIALKNGLKRIRSIIDNFEMTAIFIFLASYIFRGYSIWIRILFSLGVSYAYKEVISDIIKINKAKRIKQ